MTDLKRESIELDDEMAALVINGEMKPTFYLPNQDGDEDVKPQSYLIAGLAILLTDEKYLMQIEDMIHEKFDSIKTEGDKQEWLSLL